MGVGRGRVWDCKGHEETFGGDDYVHYPDYGDSFTGVYVCQHYKNIHFKYVYFIYVNYTSVKLF